MLRHHTIWTKVEFLGCYDTVAALGLPFKTASALLDGIPGFRHKFHDFALSDSVEHAYHALAIDDERKTFHPVLWDAHPKVRQVWFCGMHTDVGGGYDKQALSNIPLVWMTQAAVDLGLRIYPEHAEQIKEDADGFMHDSRGKGTTKLYRRMVRLWPEGRSDKPVIHQSAIERRPNQGNTAEPNYCPWIRELDHDVEPWVHYEHQPWRIDVATQA